MNRSVAALNDAIENNAVAVVLTIGGVVQKAALTEPAVAEVKCAIL